MWLPGDVGKPIVGKLIVGKPIGGNPIVGARPLVAAQGSISLCIITNRVSVLTGQNRHGGLPPTVGCCHIPKVRPKGVNLRGDFMS